MTASFADLHAPVPATRWHGLELRHLRALVAIANTSSFSEAAAVLGYVQSTVSYNLTALETAVGLTLVRRRRGSKDTTLTPVGEALASHARRILAELSHAESAVDPHGNPSVVVAVSTDIARFLLPQLYTVDLGNRRALQVLEVLAADAASLLSRGACGLALLEPADDPQLISRPVYKDRMVFIEAASRRNRTDNLGRSELSTVGLIVHKAREGRMRREFEARELQVNFTLRADTDQATIELVAAGLGSAVIPELALRHASPAVHSRCLDPCVDLPLRIVSFGWERGREPSNAEVNLMETVVRRVGVDTNPRRRVLSARPEGTHLVPI